MSATFNNQPRVPDAVEREFEEHLQAAAYIFQETKNGRFEGAIRACAAVVQFIKKRSAPAEYAALHCPRLAFSKPKSDMHELATRDRLLRTTKMRKRDARAAINSNAARIRLCVKIFFA